MMEALKHTSNNEKKIGPEACENVSKSAWDPLFLTLK